MTAPRDAARKTLIADLKRRIKEGVKDGSEENDASWGYETGILLSRAEARIALAALAGASPPELTSHDLVEFTKEALKRIRTNEDRLWCAALLPEGPDVIERVTRRFNEAVGVPPSSAPPPVEQGARG